MQKPPPDPDVADTAPSDSVLTAYDEEHVITYLRLLDADAEGADWREVARIALRLDPEHEPDRAKRAFLAAPAPARAGHEHAARHRRVGRLGRSRTRLLLPDRLRRGVQKVDR
jgi:hypothetical protein